MRINNFQYLQNILPFQRTQNQDMNPYMASSLKPLESDTISFGAWPQIFKKVNGVTLDAVRRLNKMELSHLNNQAAQKISQKVINDASDFTRILKASMDKKFGANKYVFVSIGQSPAAIAEFLNASGVETIICPISKLSDLKNINGILKNQKLGKYFDYLKNQGLDPQKVRQSGKKYIFVDHGSTGNSLKRFEELMRNNRAGFNQPNVSFISLKDLVEDTSLFAKDRVFIDDFIKEYMKESAIKQYSPIFKLPADKIDKVQEYRDATPVNELLNMLKLLVMQKLDIVKKAA